MKPQLLTLAANNEKGGLLVSLEKLGIPFPIRRVFYILQVQTGAVRGEHAHRTLEEVVICLQGSCRIRLDDGDERHEVLLDSPTLGLYLKGMIWEQFYDFSQDCILLALANEPYDPTDYITDYQEFLKERRKTT